jgi:hypothetical protein
MENGLALPNSRTVGHWEVNLLVARGRASAWHSPTFPLFRDQPQLSPTTLISHLAFLFDELWFNRSCVVTVVCIALQGFEDSVDRRRDFHTDGVRISSDQGKGEDNETS